MAFKVIDNRDKRGGAPALVSYDFRCRRCDVWFGGLSYYSEALGKVQPVRCPECKHPAEQAVKPGTRIAVRGGEWNAVPGEIRKKWQSYWGLTDAQMQHVTRDDINREMKRRGLEFVDASYDDRVNGGKRAAGEAIETPPETNDPNAVRDYNAKRYGHEYVQESEQQIRAMYDEAARAEASGQTYDPLPKAETTDVHSTPHKIDLDKTVKDLAAAPVVAPDRRREIQGRIVTGQ